MNPRLPRVDPQQLVFALKRAGFVEQRQRGSHLHLRRETDGRRVTVPIHKGELPLGTLHAILRDADLSVDDLITLLD